MEGSTSFEDEALLRAIAKHCRCPICFGTFEDPQSLQCSHVFCKQCILKSIENSKQCPLCKGRADSRTLVPIPSLCSLIDIAKQYGKKRGIEDLADLSQRLLATQCEDSARQQSDGSPTSQKVSCSSNLLASPILIPKPTGGHPSLVNRNVPIDSVPLFPLNTATGTECSVLDAFEALTQDVHLAKTQRLATTDKTSSAKISTSTTIQSSPCARLTKRKREHPLRSSSESPADEASTHQKDINIPIPTFKSTATNSNGKERGETGGKTKTLLAATTDSSGSSSEEEKGEDAEDVLCAEDMSNGIPPMDAICALCQLNTSNRKQMKQFLQFIIEKDPSCNRTELETVDQDKIDHFLGQLCGPLQYSSSKRRKKTGRGPPQNVNPPVLYVHYLCFLWSPEVLFRDGKLLNPQAALDRSKLLKCAFCGKKGATMGCFNGRCRKSFHVPCAHLTGSGICTIDEQKIDKVKCWCAAHSSHQEVKKPEGGKKLAKN